MIVPESVKITRLECQKCGNKWFPRVNKIGKITNPKLCPKCKQTWNKPRIYKKKNNN